MDIPLSEVDRVAKSIPNNPASPMTLAEAIPQTPELKQLYNDQDYIKDLMDTAGEDGRRGAQRRHACRRGGHHRQADHRITRHCTAPPAARKITRSNR